MGFEESLIRNAPPTLIGVKVAFGYLLEDVKEFIKRKGEGCAFFYKLYDCGCFLQEEGHSR